jgi:hypothetical protein
VSDDRSRTRGATLWLSSDKFLRPRGIPGREYVFVRLHRAKHSLFALSLKKQSATIGKTSNHIADNSEKVTCRTRLGSRTALS